MDTEDTVANIQKISKQFMDKQWVNSQNGNVLSYTVIKLAALKAYLGDVKEFAHAEALEAEIEMDRVKAQAYKRAMENSSATAAKDSKYDDEEFVAARKDYANAKVLYEKIKSVVTDSHDLIEAIRSRIIYLQGAAKDEQVG